MRCSRALADSGVTEPDPSGRAELLRGADRKIEAVEVMAAALGGVGGSGAPPGVTGRLGAGMYRELVAVTGPEERGVLEVPETGMWLGTAVVKLGRGVGPCRGAAKGGGAGLAPPRPSLTFLGAKGRKITEVVPDLCPCKPGVKGLADLLKILGAGLGAPPSGKKGLGLAAGAGKGLSGSTEASGGAL